MVKEGHIYYFIGIGGVGMSALARLCNTPENRIFGYDKTPSETTFKLLDEGISVSYNPAVSALPELLLDPEVKVIYTPAIPSDHPQLEYYQTQGNDVRKRAKFLADLCAGKKTIAVAGTHGKTTTSSILTHIFSQTNQKFTSVMGGFFNDDLSNVVQTGTKTFIVEADEYDRSFLHLHPSLACITSLEADHLDIYETDTNLVNAFEQFSNQVDQELVVAYGLPISGITYGIDVAADYKATNLKETETGYRFDLSTPKGEYKNVVFNQMGSHNVCNALGAIALADQAGLKMEKILPALMNFPGVYRRMNVFKWDNRIIIDDYAHHPTEIKTVLETLKSYYPTKKNCVIFQPHLFSRTRDFMNEFIEVLGGFDEVVLMEIYPARERPIPGIDAQSLLDAIPCPSKKCIHKNELKETILSSSAKVFALLGAGDIGVEIKQLKQNF
jgi:UDP-N-acetylmuramate--alanine ligase